MISQGLTRPVRKKFAKHCESRTAEVAAKPEITRHSPQLFSAKGQIRVLLYHSQRDEHKIFRELFFQPYIPNLHQKVGSVPPLRLVFVICLMHCFSEPCFQGNTDFLTLNSPAWHLLLKTLLANYSSVLPKGPHSSILY